MINEPMNETVRRETHEWQETYRSDILAKRRIATHGKKLRKLGIFSEARALSILDVCCGEGEMLDLLAAQGFRSLWGTDLSYTRERSERFARKSWRYVAGSATQLSFQKETFDWILCAHSLHHLWPVENIRIFIERAYACLKPGGKLALIDHYDSVQLRMAFALILSPVALLTPWTKLFRQQHLEEKEQLYGYLRDWTRIQTLIEGFPFASMSMKKELFFFYFVGKK